MSYIDKPYHISRQDADLYVEEVGDDQGKPIFYLHGGPGYNSYSFRELLGDELERYRLIYADQRGAGRSYTGRAFGLETLAEDVLSIIKTLKLQNVSLLAHGFGALIASRVAQRSAVARLILVNPWVDMPLLTRSLQRQAAHLSDQTEAALPPESALAQDALPAPEVLLEQAFGWVPGKQLFDAMQFPNPASRLRLEHADTTALFGPQLHEEPEDVWSLSVLELLPTLKLPTVVLAGQNDKTSYPDQVERVLEAMPHALMSLLDGGHYPWLDDPETFVALIHEVMALEV